MLPAAEIYSELNKVKATINFIQLIFNNIKPKFNNIELGFNFSAVNGHMASACRRHFVKSIGTNSDR